LQQWGRRNERSTSGLGLSVVSWQNTVYFSDVARPNWFYSSLAQSAAAIIGVIAAVVIARLQQQMATLRTLRRDLDGATDALTLELIRVGDLLAAYTDWATSAGEKIKARLDSPGGVAIPGERSLTTQLSAEHITSRSEAEQILERMNRSLSVVAELRPRLETFSKTQTSSEIVTANAFVKLYAAQLADAPTDRHVLDATILRANDVARATSGLESERSVKVATFTTIVLLWLAATSVVFPLSRLSGGDAHIKCWTLMLFSIGIAALPLLMIYEIIQLSRVGRYKVRIPPAPPTA
jgi:hypothetical protein